MDIRTIGNSIQVRITYGNPVWKRLKDAGFTWDRIQKCYTASDRQDRRDALEEIEDQADLFESAAKKGVGFPLHHRSAYDHRRDIQSLGGRWNPDLKAWVLPTQDTLYQALAICKGEARVTDPPRTPKRVSRKLSLYTSIKQAPLSKGGVVMQGSQDNPVFLRALNTPEPWKFSSGEFTDHNTGQVITAGFGWNYDVEEVIGTERDQLLS